MDRVTVELDEPLVQALSLLDRPLDQAVREAVVLDLYRRGTISSGKAAQLLGMAKLDFIQMAGRLGIPYFQLDDADLDTEIARARSL